LDPQAEEVKYDSGLLPDFVRFATEEIIRRSIRKDAPTPTKTSILRLLNPGTKLLREQVKHQRIKEVESGLKGGDAA